jgi:hypothetical protein
LTEITELHGLTRQYIYMLLLRVVVFETVAHTFFMLFSCCGVSPLYYLKAFSVSSSFRLQNLCGWSIVLHELPPFINSSSVIITVIFTTSLPQSGSCRSIIIRTATDHVITCIFDVPSCSYSDDSPSYNNLYI